MQWYYAVGAQRLGPVSQSQYEQLVHDGVIKPETLVWRSGQGDWKPQAQVGGVAAVIAGDPADGDLETCAVSGRRYPKREMISFEGKWISAEHRDAYFQKLREGVTPSGNFKYGNFGRRFVARFIDGLVMWVASALVNVMLALWLLDTANIFRPDTSAAPPNDLLIYQGVSFLFSVVIGVSYSVFFLRRFDATPGKLALGLKVVRPDGAKLTVGRIIGRHFADWISALLLCIGYIMAGFDAERRALHDRICDTRVIKVQ